MSISTHNIACNNWLSKELSCTNMLLVYNSKEGYCLTAQSTLTKPSQNARSSTPKREIGSTQTKITAYNRPRLQGNSLMARGYCTNSYLVIINCRVGWFVALSRVCLFIVSADNCEFSALLVRYNRIWFKQDILFFFCISCCVMCFFYVHAASAL